jgi:N-formylglutamate amidohydrolase
MISSDFRFCDSVSPLLTLAIHNGHKLPAQVLQNCGLDDNTRLREEDPHTRGFAELFPNHIVLNTSRFAVDLNRSPEHAVYLKPEDAWGLQVRKTELPEDLLLKLREAHAAWYRVLEYQLNRLLKLHPRLLILDLHSYNHRRGGADAAPDPQEQNPDIIIGRSNLKPEYYPVAERLREEFDGKPFRNIKLDCRCDVKFTGGYLSRWINAHYPDNAICLAIEFKKIFMNEWTGELDISAYEELKKIVRQAVITWGESL